MFFAEPPQTPYDLRWTMFGTPVRVHPFFWLATVILGFSWAQVSVLYLLLWVVCVFASILVHEFGHILAGRYFGSRGHIVLYGMGGLAIGSNRLTGHWQRIAVLLAGPGAQLVLYGLVWVVLALAHPGMSQLVYVLLKMLLWINSVWAFLNLIPIWPLDGGQVCRELCLMRMSSGRAVRTSLWLSIITAAAGALAILVWGPEWGIGRLTALFFAVFAFMNFQEMRNTGGGGTAWAPPRAREPWETDPDYWKSGRKNPWS